MKCEHCVKRQRLNKSKIVFELPKKSLADRYAEVLKLRQAVLRTQAALRATADIGRIVSK